MNDDHPAWMAVTGCCIAVFFFVAVPLIAKIEKQQNEVREARQYTRHWKERFNNPYDVPSNPTDEYKHSTLEMCKILEKRYSGV